MSISLQSPRVRIAGAAFIVLLAAMVLLAPRVAGAGPQTIAFSDARLKIEINGTDGDAGLQVFADATAWREISVLDPRGREVIGVEAGGLITNYGLTELFSESSEPPFEVFPFEQFKKLFPEGRYTFKGVTIDGKRLTGSFMLSHAVPATPVILAPANGDTVAPDGLVVSWEPVTSPPGIRIAGYQVLVIAQNPLRVFSADLPAGATSLAIPDTFLEPGAYKAEVLAVAANGNQTLAEVEFDIE